MAVEAMPPCGFRRLLLESARGSAGVACLGYPHGVRPLVRVALIGAVVLALARWAGSHRAPAAVAPSLAPSVRELEAACPPGQLPDQGVCIPVPLAAPHPGDGVPGREEGAQRDRDEQRRRYEELPLRAERPVDYGRYRLPVNVQGNTPLVKGDAEPHLLNSAPGQPTTAGAVAYGGIDIAVERGAPVRLPTLDNQVGEVEVVFVGPLFGTTVVTQHQVREANVTRSYLVLFGHLQHAAPDLKTGARPKPDAVLGLVGDSGSPGQVQLHLEIRRVRDGVTPSTLGAPELVHRARTIATDPRNVLPLKG